jgi:hypothetical protein
MHDNTKTGLFFRIPADQKAILVDVAKKEERNLQAIFTRALREYIQKYHGMQFAPQEEESVGAL